MPVDCPSQESPSSSSCAHSNHHYTGPHGTTKKQTKTLLPLSMALHLIHALVIRYVSIVQELCTIQPTYINTDANISSINSKSLLHKKQIRSHLNLWLFLVFVNEKFWIMSLKSNSHTSLAPMVMSDVLIRWVSLVCFLSRECQFVTGSVSYSLSAVYPTHQGMLQAVL